MLGEGFFEVSNVTHKAQLGSLPVFSVKCDRSFVHSLVF